MSQMSQLLINPITIIGTILAFIFISMGYLRHLGIKHAAKDKDRVKPYKIGDPFHPAAPPSSAPPEASPPPTPSLDAEPVQKKIFRQFPGAGQPQENKDGYIWE